MTRAALDTTTAAQRQRLLAALRHAPITTLAARKTLDVLHPAGRVMELRKAGHEIITHWTHEHTAANVPHRVARYILLKEARHV